MTARSALERVVCRRCRAAIGWVRTEQGKPMPVDFEPNPAGNVIVTFRSGQLVGHVILRSEENERRVPEGVRYMPHFATCGKAGQTVPPPKPPADPEPEQMGLGL